MTTAATDSTAAATFAKASITIDLAQRILAAAMASAAEYGFPMVIAIVDESGVLKAFSRMDGANALAMQMAQDKAYTATFGLATDAWPEFLAKRDPPLSSGAYTGIERLVTFGGGLPIRVDDAIVGGIGVSGGPCEVDVAQAGLAVLDGQDR